MYIVILVGIILLLFIYGLIEICRANDSEEVKEVATIKDIPLSDLIDFSPSTFPEEVEYNYFDIEFVYTSFKQSNTDSKGYVLYDNFIFTKTGIKMQCEFGIINLTKDGELKPDFEFVAGRLHPLLVAIYDYKKYLIRKSLAIALELEEEGEECKNKAMDLSKAITLSEENMEPVKYKYKKIKLLNKFYGKSLRYKGLYFTHKRIRLLSESKETMIDLHYTVDVSPEILGEELYRKVNRILHAIYEHYNQIRKEQILEALNTSEGKVYLQTAEVTIKNRYTSKKVESHSSSNPN